MPFTEPKPVKKPGESAIDFDTRETQWRQRKQDAERDESGGVKDTVAPNSSVTKDSKERKWNPNNKTWETVETVQPKEPIKVEEPEESELDKAARKNRKKIGLSMSSLGGYRA